MPPPSDHQPCPAGSHAAVCSRLIDLGTQETTYQGKTRQQHKVYIEFIVPGERSDDDTPMSVGNRYTFSSSPKSTLRQHLESWRGKRFTDDEISGFELSDILGKPALVNVTHQVRDGRTYADISSLSPIPKGMEIPTLDEPEVYLSLDPSEFDPATFASLTDRLKNIIAKSPEYLRIRDRITQPITDVVTDTDDPDIPF